MIEHYWSNIANNTYGLVKYSNYSSIWIGTYAKYNNEQGEITINGLSNSYPFQKGVLTNAVWHWSSIVTNNDLNYIDTINAPYFDGNSYPTLALAVQACVDSLPNERHKTYFRTVEKGSLYRAIIQKYNISADYSSALVFSYDYDNPLTVYCKVGGVWQVPKKL